MYYLWLCCLCFFFVNQKTSYDMRISDWSSDVCSSDLLSREEVRSGLGCPLRRGRTRLVCGAPLDDLVEFTPTEPDPSAAGAVVDLDKIGRALCRERVCQEV